MSLALIYPEHDMRRWVAALRRTAPALKVEVWPEIEDYASVDFVVCWKQPPGLLGRFPNLKCISSLGAGVNHLLADPDRPPGVPLVRLVDADLRQSMAEYVMFGALEHFRRFAVYREQQRQGEWRQRHIPHISEVAVGIMGFGALGAFVGGKLHDFGFPVHGWSRTPKEGGTLPVFAGEEGLTPFLNRSRVLVCLLPLTEATENILNASVFARLPRGAGLINAARGKHLVEADLLAALADGQLAGALLDVCREEPLPPGHPFWNHERIVLTPHIASMTNPDSAAGQIVENFRRALAGKPLLYPVDIERGY